MLGTKAPKSKLVDDHEVIAIFALSRRGLTGEQIGEIFGLNRNTVNKILARRSYASVPVPPELLSPKHAGRFSLGLIGAGR